MKDPKIFSDCYQMVLTLFHRTQQFPRPLRPTLGRGMEQAALALLLHLKKALMRTKAERTRHLERAAVALDDFRLLVQLARDLNALPINGFAEISQQNAEIGKELGGLLKYTKAAN